MANPLQGSHRVLFGRFNFEVRIKGFQSAAFQNATGLAFNIAPMEYWEGGALVAFKEPGRATFDDLTLERGVSYDTDFYDWIVEVIDVMAKVPYGAGQVSPTYKRDMVIHQLERDKNPVLLYPLADAFPIKFAPTDFDNTTDEVSIESVTFTYRYFTREENAAQSAST